MPTANPRISITLTPSMSALLRGISEHTGNSQSALIADLLESQQPLFERMLTVLQAAKKVRQDTKERMATNLDAAQTRMEQQLGLLLTDFDQVTRPVLEAAEKIDRRGARTRALAQPRRDRAEPKARATPMSNRGVTPLPKTGKQRRKGA